MRYTKRQLLKQSLSCIVHDDEEKNSDDGRVMNFICMPYRAVFPNVFV